MMDNKTLKIRQAKVGDIPAILVLLANAVRKLSDGYYSREQIEAIVRSQSTYLVDSFRIGSELIFIGEIEQQPVATACLTVGVFPVAWSRQLRISGAYVHPDFARQGISRQMLQEIEETARQKNVSRLTVTSSLAAVPFYRAMGYADDRRTFFHIGRHRIDCMDMSKSVASQAQVARQFSLLESLFPLF